MNSTGMILEGLSNKRLVEGAAEQLKDIATKLNDVIVSANDIIQAVSSFEEIKKGTYWMVFGSDSGDNYFKLFKVDKNGRPKDFGMRNTQIDIEKDDLQGLMKSGTFKKV